MRRRNFLLAVAGDAAGNQSSAWASVTLDTTAPAIRVESPGSGRVTNLPGMRVAGRVEDASGVASLALNGQVLPLGADGSFETTVALVEGVNEIVLVATDLAANSSTVSRTVTRYTVPEVRITAPADLSVVGGSSITVTGTVTDPFATVAVDGIPAATAGGNFSATVPLVAGANLITAVATSASGAQGSATVSVRLDDRAPRVHINSPANGSTIFADRVTIAGMVNDIVPGTVNPAQATVSVNGRPAVVSNRGFLLPDLPLSAGVNTITAVATDAHGNTAQSSIRVTRATATGAQLRIVSGDNQSAPIGEALPAPLVVEVLDPQGRPLAGRTVVFRVVQNDGHLGPPSPGPFPRFAGEGETALAFAATTDDFGRAAAWWTLGMRAGAGNQRVRVRAQGVTNSVEFGATGQFGPPWHIVVDDGNNQTGIAGQALPRPLVAVVTDAGHNRLGGVPVTFRIVSGGGSFGGGAAEITVLSDSDGRAIATPILGPEPGNDVNVFEASFAGNPQAPASFVASARVALDPSATAIGGVVLDNSNNPIEGVLVGAIAPGFTRLATTDAAGQFRISPVPVGHVELMVDGGALLEGRYPRINYDMFTVAGTDNTLPMPIYLVELDQSADGLSGAVAVNETTGGTITLGGIPGFALEIAPGSVTFPGGGRSGTVSATVVHADKVPMVPNFGQQPRLILTIQPSDARFDPPAVLTLPNTDGLPIGAITEMYSFDHDIGSFVAIGTGTVSEDGLSVRSDPGCGIIKGGWHCGGNPGPTGSTADISLDIHPDPLLLQVTSGVSPTVQTEVVARVQPVFNGEYLALLT